MNKRLLSLLLAALLLLALLPAAWADGALASEQEVLELFAEKKAAKAEEFEFTCDKALFQSLLADNASRLSVLEIKGGMVEGRFCDADQMKAVAQIPGREILLGRLLGSMNSPIANFARVVKQIAEKGEGAAAD